MGLVVYIVIFFGIYVSLYVIYHIGLLITHLLATGKASLPAKPKTKFGIVVPAHNERLLLPKLLESIGNQKYPPDLFSTIVVADNCIDNTAEVAHQRGAVVLERFNERKRGKGYAIQFVLETIDMAQYDAILVMDADSVMSDTTLLHLDGTMRDGKRIIQCYNGVGNPDDSWFTRLLDVSRTIGNEIYHPAKQKLGLSSYLMGNGMCFTTEILRKYGWDAFTVGEDWEYYIKLIQKGEVIGFARDARVYHQESSSLKQATSQRLRWSSGRFAIAMKYGFTLLLMGIKDFSLIKIDASLPLLFPNPSLGINLTLLGISAGLLLPRVYSGATTAWFSTLAVIQIGLFCIGVLYTEKKLKNLLSIFFAPAFLLWKMGIDALSAFGLGRKTWVRTERKLR